MFRYAVSPPGARKFRVTGRFDRSGRACCFAGNAARRARVDISAVGWKRPGCGQQARLTRRGRFHAHRVFPSRARAGLGGGPGLPRRSRASAAFRRVLRRSSGSGCDRLQAGYPLRGSAGAQGLFPLSALCAAHGAVRRCPGPLAALFPSGGLRRGLGGRGQPHSRSGAGSGCPA